MTTDEAKQKMWEEIKRSMEGEFRTQIRPDERTKDQLKVMFGVGNGQIVVIIERLIKEGKITSRPALSKGKTCTAYSLSSEYFDKDTNNSTDNES